MDMMSRSSSPGTTTRQPDYDPAEDPLLLRNSDGSNTTNNYENVDCNPNDDFQPIITSVYSLSQYDYHQLQDSIDEGTSTFRTTNEDFIVLKPGDPDPPILLPIGALTQVCIFCPENFNLNEDYETHIPKCNPVLTRMNDFATRKCLVCNQTFENLNVTGLLRHSINCIIVDRSNRESADAEARAKRTRNTADQVEFGTLTTENDKATSSANTIRQDVVEVSRSTCSVQQNSQIHATKLLENSSGSNTYSSPHKLSSNIKQYNGFSQLPIKLQSIMTSAFKANPKPKALTVIGLSQKVGLSTSKILAWFSSQRRKITSSDYGSDPDRR